MKLFVKKAVLVLVMVFFAMLMASVMSAGIVHAATITVTSLNDSGPGSLRQAIADAATGDTIDFAVTGTVVLTSGELTINKDLTIEGPGSGDLTISGNNANRVFNISGGNITIRGVTVQLGATSGDGGGIYNSGTLTVTSSTIGYNTGYVGGAVYNKGTMSIATTTISHNIASSGTISNDGTLTLTNSIVNNNTADSGGGISNGGTVNLTNSTVSYNTVFNSGGGIFNFGMLSMVNSTINNNTANSGGGIYNSGGGDMAVIKSTISYNGAVGQPGDGGGIYNTIAGNTVRLINSTVSYNTALHDGGGIANQDAVEMGSTIVAGNMSAIGQDCFSSRPSMSLGYNLISEASACSLEAAPGDLVGTRTSPIDPMLGPLQDNGGPSFTHALLPGSPAIDHIPPAFCGSSTDQRGIDRPQGPACDIGAFEVEASPAPQCALAISYTEGVLNLGFTLGTPDPATWGLWLVLDPAKIISLVPGISLPIIDPPISRSIPIQGFPHLGTIGFLSKLTAPDEEITCWDFETVDTGSPAVSPEETIEKIPSIFPKLHEILPKSLF